MATAGTCTVIPRTAEIDFWSAQISWYPAHTHPLTVSYQREGTTGCQVCTEPIPPDECAYGSRAPLVPEWRFEHEGHPFASIEIGYKETSSTAHLIRNPCRTCGEKGDRKFFKCLYPGCVNYCHFHCIPFDVPQSIKHEYHYHPLTFAEPFAEEGITVHYCDACEVERDPKARVYRCAECNFNAHTACAISKVLPALIAEREVNPSELVFPPFCGDPKLEELSLKIKQLLGNEVSLKRELEKTSVELDKAERVCAALMQMKEQGNDL